MSQDHNNPDYSKLEKMNSTTVSLSNYQFPSIFRDKMKWEGLAIGNYPYIQSKGQLCGVLSSFTVTMALGI